MKAKLRDPDFLDHATFAGSAPEAKSKKRSGDSESPVDRSKLRPLTVLYGSNTGTCEALAQGLASSAPEHGFNATVQSLDESVGGFAKDTPTVVFTASYEGQPPDNAGHFVEWITNADGSAAKGVPFAVFGVGNSKTYLPAL